jgi:hypothetical protein
MDETLPSFERAAFQLPRPRLLAANLPGKTQKNNSGESPPTRNDGANSELASSKSDN